ncbi:MAG: tyrosine--tRNA ligase [Saprospiraceae bacterium]|nr:tyrosine--tRNA ligase [Saprospiraceae bacterium]
MNFLEELKWRGMLHEATHGIEEIIDNQNIRGYIGFDPTAPSLTLGNYVQVMLLTLFQKSGHTPIVLMGGATGRIGDPSGKDKERTLKSYEELDNNLSHQIAQMKKMLNFEEGDNKAILVNNLDFYKEMNVLTFLRDVGKTLTINYMMSKESVKRRIDTGISFTEFSYQLLQAYDFQRLYEDLGCIVQMGGSDQWGNITSGTEFIRRNTEGKAYAITTPLLTKADGSKFGKSESGNIWLDAKLTSPYRFYQFWLKADDKDVPKFTRYFTLHTKEEIEARENTFADNPQELKRLLAEELTKRLHGDDAYHSVVAVTEKLFGRNSTREMLLSLDENSFVMMSEEMPSFSINKDVLSKEENVIDILSTSTTICSSKSDARRAIQGNAISINKVKINAADAMINEENLIHGKYLLVENGKTNKYLIIID